MDMGSVKLKKSFAKTWNIQVINENLYINYIELCLWGKSMKKLYCKLNYLQNGNEGVFLFYKIPFQNSVCDEVIARIFSGNM